MTGNTPFRGRACSGQPTWTTSRLGDCLAGALITCVLTVVLVVAVGAVSPTQATPTRPTVRLDLTRVPGHLPPDAQLRFIAGRSFFKRPWVQSGATTTLRDGLGPHYSARSCAGCHVGAGRSSPVGSSPDSPAFDPEFADVSATRLMARFDATENAAAFLPLGTTWQAFSTTRTTPRTLSGVEGQLQLRYTRTSWRYPDGRRVIGRRPDYRLSGAPPASAARAVLSVRIAPSLELVARIEQVSNQSIVALADPSDLNKDGISGRIHPRIARAGWPQAGRFGLKARHPTLRHQVAAALQEDLGITSSLFPEEACAPSQAACLAAPNGRGASVGGRRSGQAPDDYEISDQLLDQLVTFLMQIESPAPPPPQTQGHAIFTRIGCAQCHVPTLAAPVGNLRLFSDLLLHDMGDGLADHGPGAGELAREWRTAPLSKLRLRTQLTATANYLHDGRATTIEQAVLWHGGEAQQSRQRFSGLSATNRKLLINYVGSL